MHFAQALEVRRRPIEDEAVRRDHDCIDMALAIDRNVARTVAGEEIVSG
jgi:hypothetical protein